MVDRPNHDAAPERKVPATVIATWPAGTFVENIVAFPDGVLVVSLLSERRLAWIEPDTGRVQMLMDLPASPTGLALIDEDLFVSAGELGRPGWSIHRVNRDGPTERWMHLPEALFLNGSTPFREASLLVVDSLLGKIFEVDTRARCYRMWLDHPLLAKCTDEPMMPGVNGVKVFRDSVYLTSTERALILRVAVQPSGAAGMVEVLAERFVGDDFALDVEGNLYVATHVYNQLQRLAPHGERTVLAGAEQGLHGSTAVAFGRGPSDRDCLYITTTGGIIAPIDGRVREAKLIRVDVGIAGAALGI